MRNKEFLILEMFLNLPNP